MGPSRQTHPHTQRHKKISKVSYLNLSFDQFFWKNFLKKLNFKHTHLHPQTTFTQEWADDSGNILKIFKRKKNYFSYIKFLL